MEFKTFESGEDMLAALEKIRKDARRALDESPALQKFLGEMRHDSVCYIPPELSGCDIAIFGRISEAKYRMPTLHEAKGDDEMLKELLEEHAYEVESEAENRANGFVFGKWYSVACPEGEYGSQHVSRMRRISKRTGSCRRMPTGPS